MVDKITAHFVQFFSPGTFVAETSTKAIEGWDVEVARSMAETIVERYGATPYGFQFLTRERGLDDLDSKVVARSPMHYLNCRTMTLEEVEADDPNSILAQNMRSNGYDRVVTTTEGWQWTQPLREGDIVL